MGLGGSLPVIVGLGIAATMVVSLINVVLLIYAMRQNSTPADTRVLHEGDCNVVAMLSTVAHLGINVLGTLVLGASNAAMQCLSAPTRENIDRAHAKGRWLDIGIGSIGNFRHIGMRRQISWLALLVTSLPLHILYNSIFIQSTSASQYWWLVVTQDFLQGAPTPAAGGSDDMMLWDFGVPSSQYNESYGMMQHIQSQVQQGKYTHMSYDDCANAYSNPVIQGRTNAVWITNITTPQSINLNYSVIAAMYSGPDVTQYNASLFIDPTTAESEASWQYFDHGIVSYEVIDSSTWSVPAPHRNASVDSCLSFETATICRIEFYAPFMAIVIICNVLKISVFASLLYGFTVLTPLFTIGDAVSSFLRRPDPYTEGGRAIDISFIEMWALKIKKSIHSKGTLYTSPGKTSWAGLKRCRVSGMGGGQNGMAVLVFGAWVVAGAVLIKETNGGSLSTLWANGFGNPYPVNVMAGSPSLSLPANIIISNAPQLLISIFYLVYNQYLTTLCIFNEMSRFGAKPQYLRVTSPTGKQHSSYWLGLPYRYSVPLLLGSAILHWAVSQTVFLASISVMDPTGHVSDDNHIFAVGYSVIGAIIMYGVGWIMILALIVFIRRPMATDIPPMGSCSLAISAACHGQDGRSVDPEQKIKYGVTEVIGEKLGRVGFSNKDVDPLQQGWRYDGPEKSIEKDSLPLV